MLIFLLPRSGQRVSNAAARVRTLLRYVACSIISTVCVWEKKNMLRYLVKWEGSCLLADTDREIGGWKQTDTHVHTHTQGGGGGNLVPAYTAAIFLRRGKTISHTDLSCSVSDRKASLSLIYQGQLVWPRTNSMLFHPAAPCWRTQHLAGSLEGWLTDPPASNGLIINVLLYHNELIRRAKT